jgi:hypothetical protein
MHYYSGSDNRCSCIITLVVIIGVENISLATLDKIENFKIFAFHYSKTLNSKPLSCMNTSSYQYIFEYDLGYIWDYV